MASVSVSGTATVSAPCQSVTVDLTMRRRGSSSRKAREEAKRALEDVYGKVRGLAAEGIRFEKEGMEASFAIDMVHAPARHSPSAEPETQYEARYALRLVSEDHDRFADIFEAIPTSKG